MSNMVVRTNVLALNSHRNLGNVGNMQARSSARLSSGFRINSAADDAAGLAISEKMRAQIRGLDQASRNAQDGVSLIQTAEGAMNTINEMGIRIRELVVQAANDTNAHDADNMHQSDRTRIQAEINQLLEEIDATTQRVEFNTRTLLDGSLAADPLKGVSAADVNSWLNTNQGLRDDITAAEGTLSTNQATLAVATNDLNAATAIRNQAQTAAAALQTQLQDMHALITAGLNDGSISSAAADAEVAARIADLETSLGIGANSLGATITNMATLATNMANATNATSGAGQIVANAVAVAGGHADFATLNTSVTAGGTLYDARANAQTDVNNAQTAVNDAVTALNDAFTTAGAPGAQEDLRATLVETFGDVSAMIDALEASEAGDFGPGLWFQIGANVGQGVNLNIESVDVAALDRIGFDSAEQHGGVRFNFAELRNTDMSHDSGILRTSGEDINRFLTAIDHALAHTTEQRSNLGAMQNRLEFTIENLDIASENLSAAESRIRDADMAKEMMRLTQANVLQQAATSMLAQANQAPNNVLQLLG